MIWRGLDKLDEFDGSGGRGACNAIARALAHLSGEGQDQSSECFGRMTALSALQTTTMPSVKGRFGSGARARDPSEPGLVGSGKPTFSAERWLSGGCRWFRVLSAAAGRGDRGIRQGHGRVQFGRDQFQFIVRTARRRHSASPCRDQTLSGCWVQRCRVSLRPRSLR